MAKKEETQGAAMAQPKPRPHPNGKALAGP